MRLAGPVHCNLQFNSTTFRMSSATGEDELSRELRACRPKLYVVVSRGRIIYVGITNQPMRARLRLGWTATGKGGYYGYAFRHHLKRATLLVWFHTRRAGEAPMRDLETIEAEVAYLVRRRGQWPTFQTEIHFHRSSAAHRKVARSVVAEVQRAR